MKQCPKCNSTCSDDDIICKNCGYLFTPEGFGSDDPSQNSFNGQNSVPPQDASNNPYVVPSQNGFNNQNAVPPQGDLNNPNAVPPQGDLNNPNAVPPQGDLNNPNVVPPQGNFNNQNAVPTQGNFNNPNTVPTQGNFNNPNTIPPQDNFNTSYGAPAQNNFNNPNAVPPQSNSWQESYNQGGTNNVQEPTTNGLSIASLVLGIIGVVFSCCYGIGIAPSIVSLILGIISMNKVKKSEGSQKGSGMSLAGIILAGIGILISICFIIVLVYFASHPEDLHQFLSRYNQYSSYGASSSPF